MDSKFTVYYFPAQVRGENIRLLLAYAKANWENKFVSNWMHEKYNTEGLLYKQVPMLIEKTASGKENRLVQSGAIIHYLATIFKLETEDVFQNAILTSYFDGVCEINDKIDGYIHKLLLYGRDISDAVRRAKEDPRIRNLISCNEEILSNNGSNGHYMGDKTTYVDIVAFNLVDKITHIPGMEDLVCEENTPNIMKVYDTVKELPEIAAYLKSDKRPRDRI